MKKNINRTLKMKLFISPHPVCNEKEFFQMRYRMFGDERDIIEFLEATETLKKIAVAKKIVYRLAFQSNFSPSLDLLDYLAEFESTIRYNRSVSHPSRDHYIHICYLYLLGIYLFFYAPELNERLHNSMSLIRYSEYLNEEDNFVKSFLGAWKYFVLFHDIAYPLEYLGNKNGKYNVLEKEAKQKAEDLYERSSVRNGMLSILSLKILARTIAIGGAIEDLSERTNNLFFYLEKSKEQFTRLDGEKKLSEYIKDKRKSEIVYLQNIKSGDDIKVFLSVYKWDDFFVVLKKESAIKCIIDNKNCFVSNDCMENDVIEKIRRDRELLFQDELFRKCPEFQIEYYGIDLQPKYEKFVHGIKLQPPVLQQMSFNIKNTSNMQEMSFAIFLECYDRYKKKEIEITGKNIKASCKEALINEIKNINVEIGDLCDGQYHEYATEYFRKYSEEIDRYVKELTVKEENVKKLTERTIDSVAAEKKLISNVLFYCKSIEEELIKELKIPVGSEKSNVWDMYDTGLFDTIFDKLQENTKKYIEESLQKAVKSDKSICDILKDYHMEHSEYDHGITAAVTFMLHFTIYQEMIKKCEENEMLCVGFNIPNAVDNSDKKKVIDQKYIDDYEKSSGQIIYAILVHNLYPDNFKEIQGIKTNLSSNPFAFFCMLCDALQNWGRPFNINPMKEAYPLFIDAEKYNIKADKYITIKFEEDNPHVVHKHLEPFSRTLDQYLDGASKELRVTFK